MIHLTVFGIMHFQRPASLQEGMLGTSLFLAVRVAKRSEILSPCWPFWPKPELLSHCLLQWVAHACSSVPTLKGCFVYLLLGFPRSFVFYFSSSYFLPFKPRSSFSPLHSRRKVQGARASTSFNGTLGGWHSGSPGQGRWVGMSSGLLLACGWSAGPGWACSSLLEIHCGFLAPGISFSRMHGLSPYACLVFSWSSDASESELTWRLHSKPSPAEL